MQGGLWARRHVGKYGGLRPCNAPGRHGCRCVIGWWVVTGEDGIGSEQSAVSELDALPAIRGNQRAIDAR